MGKHCFGVWKTVSISRRPDHGLLSGQGFHILYYGIANGFKPSHPAGFNRFATGSCSLPRKDLRLHESLVTGL